MEQFGDGHHVALRSTFYDTYLYADEDGRGVSLHPRRSSPNAAWVVHLLLDGGPRILLYGVSYGRYLAATKIPAPGGLRGNLVLQQNFDRREDECVLQWEAVRVASGDDVLLRSVSGQHLRASDASATVDDDDGRGMTLRWVVEAITHRDPVPKPPPHVQTQTRRASTGSVKRQGQPMIRTIRFIQCNPDGSSTKQYNSFQYMGQSLEGLKKELSLHYGANLPEHTIYVQAGSHGRATPLSVDLPRNSETLTILFFPNGMPASSSTGLALGEHRDINIEEAHEDYQLAEISVHNHMEIIQNRRVEQERRLRGVQWGDMTKEDAKIMRKNLKENHSGIEKLNKELTKLQDNKSNTQVAYERAVVRNANANAAQRDPDPNIDAA
uniref:Uncharacterized protein n=1 Tax=Oryza punctata TaxID=4537 RepID=A0A0E0L876_ORYPU|nr:hypothetical protein [Oryza punctata]